MRLIKKSLTWKIKTKMKLDVINDSLAQTDIAKMSVNIDNLTYSLMIDGIYTNKLNFVDSVVVEKFVISDCSI